ncbi:importin-5-like protein [Fagus crenata]
MLASEILPDNEFILIMFHPVSSNSPKLQESVLLIFTQLLQYNGERLVPHIEHLPSKFLQCLTSSSKLDVKLTALNTIINFIQCLPSSADPNHFQNLLPEMWKTLTKALYLYNSDLLKAKLMKAKKRVALLAKDLKDLAKTLDNSVLQKRKELDASVVKD